jgi:SPRY domain.
LGGFYDQIAVGFAISNQYPTEEFAGYLEGSIAFHGDDGKVFLNGKIVGNLCNFGSHDIVGCGITNNGFVYFTHNGNLMYEYKTNFKGPVYPIISLRGKYSSVQINLEGGFLFNYEEFRELIDSNDFVKFVSPIVLESILINSDWIQILQKLYELDSPDWLGQVIKYLVSRREKPLTFRESEVKEEKIFEDKNFDILKELQSIDILLRESKRSVKEFTSKLNFFYI